MQVKSTFTNTSKLTEPRFRNAPKVLNSINMVMAIGEFIAAMLNSIVLLVTKVYKAVIRLKSIGVN